MSTYQDEARFDSPAARVMDALDSIYDRARVKRQAEIDQKAWEQRQETVIRPRVEYQLQSLRKRPPEHAFRIPGKHSHAAFAMNADEVRVAGSHPNLCYDDWRCYWAGGDVDEQPFRMT